MRKSRLENLFNAPDQGTAATPSLGPIQRTSNDVMVMAPANLVSYHLVYEPRDGQAENFSCPTSFISV